MFNYTLEIYENGIWNEVGDFVRPFTDGDVLDNTLDEGKINLKATSRSTKIKPFTPARIGVYENETFKEYIYRIVGTSRITKKYINGSVYDWDIQTIEPSKLLEREFISTMTSTRPLQSTYTTAKMPPDTSLSGVVVQGRNVEWSEDNTKWTSSPLLALNDIDFNLAYSVPDHISWTDPTTHVEIYYYVYRMLISIKAEHEDGEIITIAEPSDALVNEQLHGEWVRVPRARINAAETQYSWVPERIGKWKITWEFGLFAFNRADGLDAHINTASSATEIINIFSSDDSIEIPTISSVCQRLIDAGVTRRESESPKYTLDGYFYEKYENVEAPNMSFSNCTLWDALTQIGGYIHAIPRLIVNTSNPLTFAVTFDELGGEEDVTDKMPPECFSERSQDINDFCGSIDSPSQNLINTQDVVNGSVSDFANDYITVRTDEGNVVIDADSMKIKTAFPIYRIIKAEIRIDGWGEKDITSYIYESSEYQTLSSYVNVSYPYSKAWAIYYTKGGNTIEGLQFKVKDYTGNLSYFQNMAITNIINAVYAKTTNDLSFNTEKKFINTGFRITYVPIINARVQQHKPNKNFADFGNTSVYNQGASLAETRAYGEQMKGAIARLGNEVERKTYNFTDYSKLPKIGQLINGKYISRVDKEYGAAKIKATVTLTPDFNQLSQFVGINSEYRLFEINKNEAVERHLNYGEHIVIGDSETPGTDTIFQDMNAMTFPLFIRGTNDYRVKAARIITYDEANNKIGKVLTPVVSFAFGNSLAFSFTMNDNYGAGLQSTDEYSVDLGQQNKSYKRIQRQVPYVNSLGQFKKMFVEWRRIGWNLPTDPDDYSDLKDGGNGNLYPETPSVLPSGYWFRTGSDFFIVDKDSREKISLVYQIHFTANRDSIVIGSALSQNNPLVKNLTETAGSEAAYFFTHKLNGLRSKLDIDAELEAGTAISASRNYLGSGDTLQRTITGPTNNTGAAVESWAIVDKDGNIYLGENMHRENGEAFPNIYLTITK